MSRLIQNQSKYIQKFYSHPYHVADDRGSPDKFHKETKVEDFLCIPLKDSRVWMFKEFNDREVYRIWAKKQKIVWAKWRMGRPIFDELYTA